MILYDYGAPSAMLPITAARERRNAQSRARKQKVADARRSPSWSASALAVHLTRRFASALGLLFASLLFAPPLCAGSRGERFETSVVLPDECAVFNEPTSDPNVTRIAYGESIDFDINGTVRAAIVGEGSNASLLFQFDIDGDGVGNDSLRNYRFSSRVGARANLDADSSDPGLAFRGKFEFDAPIIGEGTVAGPEAGAQRAPAHGQIGFSVLVHYADGQIKSAVPSDFAVSCFASPWVNQMMAPLATDPARAPVGRGFGDPWNKYAWSMKHFNGGVIVGTNNASYDYRTLLDLDSDPNLAPCIQALAGIAPILRGLGCMELFASGSGGVTGGAGAVMTDFAELWRFDNARRDWAKLRDEDAAGTYGQGFHKMITHEGRLYASSDLGSIVMGIELGSWNGDLRPGRAEWNFPGSRLLVSDDGTSWSEVACTSRNPNPCEGMRSTSPLGRVNTSFRAMASYKGRLYLGTRNYNGSEVWSFDARTSNWSRVAKFRNSGDPICRSPSPWAGKCTNVFSTGVTDLLVYDNVLFAGVYTPVGGGYLWQYDGTEFEQVVGTPAAAATTSGVLTLFANSKGVLFVGLVDFTNGFTLVTYDGSSWSTVTTNGFDNPANAYAWSMAEANGRTFLGTFNREFLSGLPRGSAELWYSDDAVSWQQMALPLRWGAWNYGIRTMEVTDTELFVGSASNLVAPDVPPINLPIPIGPGMEVWSVPLATVAPAGGSR